MCVSTGAARIKDSSRTAWRRSQVSAKAQSKWWFAKKFLHPDVVASYSLIFVWDEDIGVDAFDVARCACGRLLDASHHA